MALRPLYGALRPDLDKFLYAAVGEEQDGMPLSMISALARLGLDPWVEAGRLSSLAKPEASDQLGQMILRLTGTRWRFPEARRVAAGLVELLPTRDQTRGAAEASHSNGRTVTSGKTFWLVCFLLAAAALAGMAATGEFPIGRHAPPELLPIASPEYSRPPSQ